MSAEVIALQAPRPHITSPVRCMNCGHEWQVVREVGSAAFMECPSCKLIKGVYTSVIWPNPSKHIWECGCGGLAFFITLDGFDCMSCGKTQQFSEGPWRA